MTTFTYSLYYTRKKGSSKVQFLFDLNWPLGVSFVSSRVDKGLSLIHLSHPTACHDSLFTCMYDVHVLFVTLYVIHALQLFDAEFFIEVFF